MKEHMKIEDGSGESSRRKSFDALLEKCREAPCHYRAYMELGELYEEENADQAYLTYEHARYLCMRQNREEGMPEEEYTRAMSFLGRKLSLLRQDARYHVHPASFIILSFNTLDLTKKCLESIRKTCDMDACEIVIVDNNSHDGSKEWLREQKDIVFVDNDYNAGFPGGCNLGFAAASPSNDMLLLNSDTEMTENALYTLRMGLYSDRRNGLAGGFSNANYVNEFPEYGRKLPLEKDYYDYGRQVNIPGRDAVMVRTLVFAFYILIRRDVFNKVGEWDELYNPGNYDDHDYCYRVLQAGYRNVLCWNSFIIHRAHRSFKRNAVPHMTVMQINCEKFIRKWGFHPDVYADAHRDMLSMIKHGKEEAFSLLFIGCGCGDVLLRLKEQYPASRGLGLEKNPVIARMGSAMAPVREGNIEEMTVLPAEEDPRGREEPGEEKLFDYVMLADTLETCADPEKVLEKAGRCLKPGGAVVCSVRNLLNARIIRDLLKGSFMDGLQGSDVNFFTPGDMRRLFADAGFVIEYILNIHLREITTDCDRALFDSLCAVEGVTERKNFDTYRLVFRLRRKETGNDI